MDTPNPSRRTQIIRAALQRYRSHTVGGTTLRDVAQTAEMPLGNLYYFKSRDDLVIAALDECQRELHDLLRGWAPLAPAAWLHHYFDWLLADPEQSTAQGCPFGTLASELRATGHPAADHAAQIVRHYREAVLQRAAAVGVTTDLFMTVQGAYTVSRTLNDPGLFERSVRQLRAAALPGHVEAGDPSPSE